MAKINESERKTQDHVLQLFQNELGYKFYGNLRGQVNKNIIVEKLRAFLLKSFTRSNSEMAWPEGGR